MRIAKVTFTIKNMTTEITNEQLEEVAEMYHTMIEKYKKGESNPFLKSYRKYHSDKKHFEIELPNIKSIDNMKIFKVSLLFMRENEVWLQIRSDSIRKGYDIDDETCVCYFEENACQMLYNESLKPMTTKNITKCVIKRYLRIAIDTLPLLKFDRYIGKFTKNSHEMKFMESWNDILRNCDGISTKSDECCVCREDTLTTTSCCGNKLCYYCWDKIKEKQNEDIHELPELPCPMCRSDLHWD